MAVEINNNVLRNVLFVEFPYANIYSVGEYPEEVPPLPYDFEWVVAPDLEMVIQTDEDAFDWDAMSWVAQDGNFVGLRYQVSAPGVAVGTYQGSCRATILDTNQVEHEFGPIPVTVIIEPEISYHPFGLVDAIAVGRSEFENDIVSPIMFVMGWVDQPLIVENFHIQSATLPTEAARFADPANGNIIAMTDNRGYIISGQVFGSLWAAGFFTDPHKRVQSLSPIPGVGRMSPSRGAIWRYEFSGSSIRSLVQTAYPNHAYYINNQTLASQQVTVPDIEFLRGQYSFDIFQLRRQPTPDHLLFCCRNGRVVVFTDPLDLTSSTVINLSADNGGADFRSAYRMFYDTALPSYTEGTWAFDEIDMLISEDGSVFRSTNGATSFTRMGAAPILGRGHGISVGLTAATWPASYETPRWIICGEDTSGVNGPGDIGRNMIAYSDNFGATWTEVIAPTLPSGYSSWNGLYDIMVSNSLIAGASGHGVTMVGSINTTGGDPHGVIIRTDTTFSAFEIFPQPLVARIDTVGSGEHG